MKFTRAICTALAAVLIAGCASEESEQQEKQAEQAKLMALAKIDQETARQMALAKVPNGTIKESELEKENGKLQWSFDLATPDSKDITEVNVDAISGEIISVGKESPDEEANEDAKSKSGGDKD